MSDILKNQKSTRTVWPYFNRMLFKKEKSKSLFSSLSRMFKKKNKKDRVKEASDNMCRRKPNEDCAMLNSLERSDSGMRCNLTTVCDSLQHTEHLGSTGVTVRTVRKKQHEQSCADNGRVKELEDCGRTMEFTDQDNLHKHANLIDSRTCKITEYLDASYETEVRSRIVEKNNEKFSKMRECSNFQPETCEAEKKRKDMPMTFKSNICRPETGQDEDEICNQKPTAIVLPTRHQTVVLPYSVERNTVELAQRNVANTGDNTVVKTDEDGHVQTVNSSSNIEPDTDNTFVKDIDWSGNMSSWSIDNNSTNVPSLHERDNRSFVELNISSIASVISAEQEMGQETDGQETVQETAGTETVQDIWDVQTFTSYSEDQKSRNENKKEAVAGIHMFCQTDAQPQDNHLIHRDKTLCPPKSGNAPYSIRVGTPQEGNNALCHPQLFTKPGHEMKCSSILDVHDACITNETLEKLVQKVDHLESRISKLFRLVLFTVMFNSRIPGIMKKQDLVISERKENCKANLNENEIESPMERNLLQVSNSCNLSECQEHDGHRSSACVCLASNTFDSKSLQYSKVRQSSQHRSLCVVAEEKNSISSYSNNKGETVKTDKMLKVEKHSKRGERANQTTAMLMVERPMRESRAESDEIGHTISMQIKMGEDNLNHNMELKESMEGQAELISLVVELNEIKSSKGEGNYSCSENIDDINDGAKQGPDLLQLKDSEEKDQNHNKDKSRCLSEVSFTPLIIIGHTNKTPTENTENDAQLEMTSVSTTSEYARAVDSSGYSEKGNTDMGEIPIMDDIPAFINSDADVLCLCESVKDQVNLETDETAVSTSKSNLEESASGSNADSIHESCLDQKENVVGLSNCVLNVNSYASHASDARCLHLVDSNVSTISTNRCVCFPVVDPVISDRERVPGHGILARYEDSQQRQASVDYSCHHCLQQQDKSKEECTRENSCIWNSDLEKPRANKFVSMCKVQEAKLKGTSPIVNKKKSQRSFRSGVNVSCRLCSLQKRRRGKKRKVKLKRNTELSRKVRSAKKFPGILSDLKFLLHCLSSSFAQARVQSGTLTQTTRMIKGKTELDIVVSGKENSSQEQLIEDFLKTLVSPWFIFPTISSGLQRVILLPTGLQLYFERLLRGTPPEERERMSYEWLRLQTFINYPSSAPGSGIRLARAGFYYSGNGTVTVCYACGGQHSGWNFHDDPYEIHRRISPDCPFLRGNPTYPNVPIMQEGEQNGIHMGSNTSNEPLSRTMASSPSSSNRLSEISLPSEFQSQNSTITGAQSSAAVLPSIHSSQEGGSEQQASQKTMSKDERHLEISPSSINPASSTHMDEIPSVIHQPVTLTVAVAPNTSAESLQGQQPTTAASNVSQPQQPTDDAENTQYRNPGNFVLIKPAGQVEDPGVDPTPQTMSERPRHPEYAPLSSRVNSYTGWPARLDQTPQQMAEAGFYYAGVNDYTRCFQCGGGLRNWEPGDNPWIEHARWYPQCAYVLGKRGQRFVNAVLKKQAELLAAQNAQRNNSNTTTTINNTTINTTTTTNTSSLSVSKTGIQEPTTQSGQPRYFQNPNENEIANRLINEMGYQRERVREAILEVKRSRGQQEIAVEHVIELLVADEERRARAGRQNEAATVEELIQESGRLTLHDDSKTPPAIPPPTEKATATTTQPGPLNHVAGNRSSGQQQNGQKSGQTNQTSAPGRVPSVPQSQRNMSGPMSIAVDVPSSSSIFSNQEGSQNNKSTASNRQLSSPLMEPTSLPAFDAESLREEYMRLRDQNMCKICMERNVELAFLPCGHLVCCEVCGQALRFCPICRAKIHASVKTYLS